MVFRDEGAHRDGQQDQGDSCRGGHGRQVADSTILPDLLHGEETRVWGDQAYKGKTEVIREHAPDARDFTNRRYRFKKRIDEGQRAKNRTKSKIRSRGEHVFGVIKGVLGFVKGALPGPRQECQSPVRHLRAGQSVHCSIAFDATRGLVSAKSGNAIKRAPKTSLNRRSFAQLDQACQKYPSVRSSSLLIQTFPKRV